jgi:hypothetical protein
VLHIARLSLAAVGVLALALPASAFPIPHAHPKPPPAPHPKPPVKHNLLPGLDNTMKWASLAPYPWIVGPTGHGHESHGMTGSGGDLRAALRDVKAAEAEVAKNEYTAALGKVQAAEHIVSHDHKLATEHKETHRTGALDEILKHLKSASSQVAGHHGHEAHASLAKAAKELDSLVNGHGKPAQAKKPGK